jgi:hypothetical protein
VRCDTCQHWKKDEQEENHRVKSVGFHECGAIREPWVIENEATKDLPWPGGPHLKWKYDPELGIDVTDDAAYNAYQQREIEAVKTEQAFVSDASQYRAELYTAPDFFCARYEQLKEVQPCSSN